MMAMEGPCSVVDAKWELIDPNPNIHQLFVEFNEKYFWGKLTSVYVQWSPRMTLCAGLCRYHGRNRECSIHLSKPLLQLRQRKDLVETLLHEMIHAYLFVADNDRERESHGPKFQDHMRRINQLSGANITIYHSFNDEVNYYKTHWWKCNGVCVNSPPYFGIVKRSMNRAPGPNDTWYADHERKCGGKFNKIREPPPKAAAKRKHEDDKGKNNKPRKKPEPPKVPKIGNFFQPVGAKATGGSSAGSSGPPKLFDKPSASGSGPPKTFDKPSASAGGSGPPKTFDKPSASAGGSGPQKTFDKPSAGGSGPPKLFDKPSSSAATSPPGLDLGIEPFSGKGFKLGSSGAGDIPSGSQPHRRGDHPLLQKLFGSASTSAGGSQPPDRPDKRLPLEVDEEEEEDEDEGPHLFELLLESAFGEGVETNPWAEGMNCMKKRLEQSKAELIKRQEQLAEFIRARNNRAEANANRPEAEGEPAIEVIDLE